MRIARRKLLHLGFGASAAASFPRAVPKDIVAKLNGAAVTALADENVKVRLNKLGQQIATRDLQDPVAFAAFQKSEADKWWPIIKAANLKVE
jgi:tripartite-type tricarboxylate transporter receptor subunit TctC